MSAEMEYINILWVMVPCEMLLLICGMCMAGGFDLLAKPLGKSQASTRLPSAKLPQRK